MAELQICMEFITSIWSAVIFFFNVKQCGLMCSAVTRYFCTNTSGAWISSQPSWDLYVLLYFLQYGTVTSVSRVVIVLITVLVTITARGYTANYNIDKVQRMQNRAAGVIHGNFYFVNIRGLDLVKQSGIRNIRQRILYGGFDF